MLENIEKTDNISAKMMSFSLIDPEHKVIVPAYEESSMRSNQYVFWGPDNKFANDLQDLVYNSPTAYSVVDGTVNLIKANDIVNNLVPSDLAFYPYINDDLETVEDLVENISRDLITFGGCAVQLIFNKLDKIASIYHIPMEMLRINEDKTKAWFNRKWKKYSAKTIEYPIYKGDPADGPSQILVWTNSGRRQTYPITPFISCLEDMVSETLAAKYIKQNLESGLSARYIISLPNSANLTDEQKADIEDGITEKFTGIENAGAFALWFASTDKELTIQKVDMDDAATIYNTIRDSARDNIFIGTHSIPQLFGYTKAATGFSEQEFQEALQVYSRMVLTPMKNTIENVFARIFGENKVKFA